MLIGRSDRPATEKRALTCQTRTDWPVTIFSLALTYTRLWLNLAPLLAPFLREMSLIRQAAQMLVAEHVQHKSI
jgi:hypothetical protein